MNKREEESLNEILEDVVKNYFNGSSVKQSIELAKINYKRDKREAEGDKDE